MPSFDFFAPFSLLAALCIHSDVKKRKRARDRDSKKKKNEREREREREKKRAS
jgi:hypothetical protein